MPRTTLKDIAERLGISVSTVSRALRKHPDIHPDTQQAVAKMAEQLDYFPDSHAQSLKGGKSNIIGIIVPEIRHHFFSSVISGIEKIAYANNYTIMVCQSHENSERERLNLQALISQRVAGVLISIAEDSQDIGHFARLKKHGIPVVFFDRTHKDLTDTNRVVVDDYEGAYKLITHLIERGYSRIAHLAGPETVSISNLRHGGYRDALNDSELEYDPALVISGGYREEDGLKGMEQVLKMDQLPDAVFAVNDPVAMGAFTRLKEKGMKIPDDIALAGFCDNYFSSLIEPQLTTVSQPANAIGERAAELLIQCIEQDEGQPPTTIQLETKLMVRAST